MAAESYGYDDVILECDDKMEKAVQHLRGEFRSMRTGRATPALVEHVRVEYYGTPTPLRSLANILVPEPALLVIKPFDPSSMKEIERALMGAELGSQPQNDGKVIRVAIPPLSEERRRQLVGKAKEMAEETRISLRNVRRDANKLADEIEGSGSITEDDWRKLKDEIQELFKKYEDQVQGVLKEKSDELMQI